jgi:hypothetical protein
MFANGWTGPSVIFPPPANHLPPQDARPASQGSCRYAVARSFTTNSARAMAERNAAAGRLPATRHPPATNTNNVTSKATGIHDTTDRLRRSTANQTAGSSRRSTPIRPRKTATEQPLVIADWLNLPPTACAGKQVRPPCTSPRDTFACPQRRRTPFSQMPTAVSDPPICSPAAA